MSLTPQELLRYAPGKVRERARDLVRRMVAEQLRGEIERVAREAI